jgi:hypothetical protein
MKKKKKVKFGSLRVGKKFWEVPNEYGFAWDFTLKKIKPQIIQGDTMNARRGKVLFSFSDSDDVLI